jgi:hypothetical protein
MQCSLVHTQITTKKFNLLLIFRITIYKKYLEKDRSAQREILQTAGLTAMNNLNYI